MVRVAIDIPVGTRFGKWTVERELTQDQGGRRRFLCRCTCGSSTPVLLLNLRHGHSKGCMLCCTTRGGAGVSDAVKRERLLTKKMHEAMLKEAGII